MRHAGSWFASKTRLGAAAALVCSSVVIASCTMTSSNMGAPSSVTFTLPGSLPQTYVLVPNQGAFDGTMAPPANLTIPQNSVLPPPPGIPPSGHYEGVARAVTDPGGSCTPNVRVTNWTVDGTHVHFGGYEGTIAPDGSLTMQLGGTYVYGRFRGPYFHGEYWAPGPTCDYALALNLLP